MCSSVRALRYPGAGVVAATVLEAIGASDEPFVLVLDDYHVVRAQAIHTLVGFLIEHAPPFCHIVLLSREDPPFGLARLRAHGRLAELRAEDLRYTAEEAATFFADARPALTADELQRLVGRTEGWVAAMQLASLGLARADDSARVIGAFEGMQRHVLDYLADEVVGRMDEDLRTFLVRTSIADRFSAELCEQLTGRTDAAALLGQAERSHLFVVALDEERHWYRYHGLFADYLRSRLTERERQELHVRAADWYQRAGLPRDAIPHLLAAGAFDDAARLIEGEARGAFEAGEHTTLLRWIDALPRESAAEHADLVAWGAWALFDTGQLAAADAEAARHLAATSDRGPAEGRLLALRSLLQTVTGPDAESLAQAGLDLLGDDVFFRSSCLQAIGLARLARGERPAAVEGLTAAFELIRHAGPAVAFAGVTPLGQALLAAGQRNDAEVLCRELLEEYGTADGRRPGDGLVPRRRAGHVALRGERRGGGTSFAGPRVRGRGEIPVLGAPRSSGRSPISPSRAGRPAMPPPPSTHSGWPPQTSAGAVSRSRSPSARRRLVSVSLKATSRRPHAGRTRRRSKPHPGLPSSGFSACRTR